MTLVRPLYSVEQPNASYTISTQPVSISDFQASLYFEHVHVIRC